MTRSVEVTHGEVVVNSIVLRRLGEDAVIYDIDLATKRPTVADWVDYDSVGCHLLWGEGTSGERGPAGVTVIRIPVPGGTSDWTVSCDLARYTVRFLLMRLPEGEEVWHRDDRHQDSDANRGYQGQGQTATRGGRRGRGPRV